MQEFTNNLMGFPWRETIFSLLLALMAAVVLVLLWNFVKWVWQKIPEGWRPLTAACLSLLASIAVVAGWVWLIIPSASEEGLRSFLGNKVGVEALIIIWVATLTVGFTLWRGQQAQQQIQEAQKQISDQNFNNALSMATDIDSPARTHAGFTRLIQLYEGSGNKEEAEKYLHATQNAARIVIGREDREKRSTPSHVRQAMLGFLVKYPLAEWEGSKEWRLGDCDLSRLDLQMLLYENTGHHAARAHWRVVAPGSNCEKMIALGANFSNADFGFAKLTGAFLPHSNLAAANLWYAKLMNAELSEANLTDARLKGADLTDASLAECDLTRADLTSAKLTKANLARANLSGANLEGSTLVMSALWGADLTGANLKRINRLTQFADMEPRTDLTGADLTGADLTDANLIGANLQNANLENANLAHAGLTHANLGGVNLKNACLEHVVLSGVKMSDVDLTNVNLKGANLTNSKLKDVVLTGADLTRANLTNANLSSVNMENADLANANLSGARLGEVVFNGTRIDRADFRQTSTVRYEHGKSETATISLQALKGCCWDKRDPSNAPELPEGIDPYDLDDIPPRTGPRKIN